MYKCRTFAPLITIYIFTWGVKRFFVIFLLFFYILYIKEINIDITIYISISYKIVEKYKVSIFCTQFVHKSVRFVLTDKKRTRLSALSSVLLWFLLFRSVAFFHFASTLFAEGNLPRCIR